MDCNDTSVHSTQIDLECRIPLYVKGDGSQISTTDLSNQQQYRLKLTADLEGNALTIKYYRCVSLVRRSAQRR